MESLKQNAEKLTESITNYAETYYKLTVLKAADKATGIASASLGAVVILLLGIFVLFFLGFALALWLGDVLNSPAAGHLLVAVLFAAIIVTVVLLRKKIVFPYIRNTIIRKMYE